MATTHRVVDHIVSYLAAIGVDLIFGVDGANIEDLYDAAQLRTDITAVLAKHEFAAATMADGYSRSGCGLGVLAATSGGGCLNTVPGLGEALASRVPVLALIGQPPTGLDGRGAFQDTSGRNGALDGVALFSAVSAQCRRVLAPAEIVPALTEAVAAALARRGPAVLLLPKDIQQASIPRNGAAGCTQPSRRVGDPGVLVRALREAGSPVTVIAGEQVARDDARVELEALRAVLCARVATVPDAKDVAATLGSRSASALGVTGVMGHPGVAAAVARSGVCLLIGTRMTVTARAGLDDALATAAVYSLGCAAPYLPCTHVHTDDLRTSLTQLTAALSSPPIRVREATDVVHRELHPPEHHGPGVRYRDAMTVLDRTLPDGVDIAVDAGNIGAAAIHHLPARRDGRFLVALGMGGMGYSFGAAIGMAFGRGRRTVVIAGDGSFYMHGMEIHTAVQYGLPVTFVLFDNHAHAMCVTREQTFYGGAYSYNKFGASRLGAGLAAMFPGLAATDITDVDALPGALAAALAADGPSVVAVECAADEIPPFAAFLTQHDSKESTVDAIPRA
ncbi:thiamine pyrophosphate-binding protein [Mycobacterium sp. IDR2000157661]|uniref:thiamine pyrophosphate-binding protein n=1 Tax=Mycobacterium sp. IDR2000157661 TaxID=2867005 RepID=UPI001EEDDF82|nr:thiamine pyrophosphate-dependent enzyme [Mycobacterium sp. IDR2000157661]ULE35473.1 thiamine pyrophosphate-binding protein [Mycobacterium sp. IDR2000157661]